jgi:hypothetical protein
MSLRPIATVFGVVLTLTVSLPAQDGNGERRFMTRSRPLVEQLLPGDRHVEIIVNGDQPLWSGPKPGRSYERFWADLHDFVAVFRVESVQPRLVYRADMDARALDRGVADNWPYRSADEDTATWIVSSVRGRFEQVLKPSSKLRVNEPLTFDDEGGSLMLRGVQVDAVVPWHTPLVGGKRYLWFGSFTPDGRVRHRDMMFVEPQPGALLVSMATPGGGSRVQELTMSEAVAYVRAEMAKK